ncbi:MAG TPA: glycoside hydrolase family 13 protein [Thermoclostridium sp.]
MAAIRILIKILLKGDIHLFLEAIYHSTCSEYCHALDENTVVLRLRAKKGDLTGCTVCYGDRAYPDKIVKMKSVDMLKVASDNLFDYFEALIRTNLTRICYYFILNDGRTTVFYYGNSFYERLHTDRNRYFQFPYIRKEDIAEVPEWAKKAVIYQIFPDSFAQSKRHISGKGCEIPVGGVLCRSRFGGNLRGIIENIDYLQYLGVNCIYLNPIFTAGSYHKYDTIDYYSVDPCFGDNETLKELVDKCHKAGIRVILDGVFNHSGSNFFAFRDVLEKGEKSRYKDWFFIKGFPVRYEDNPNYMCFAYEKSMPKLNTGNKEVIEYFTNVGTYWIKEADIDGWRLDVANEVDHQFWRTFRKAVKSVKPDAFLIGEIWHDAREWLSGDQFDSVMNYMLMDTCIDFFAKRIINVEQFDARIQYLRMRYKKNIQYAQMNLLDSHDVSRFLSVAGGDVRRQKLAALFIMTHIGIPSVYSGDEKGMEGLSESEYRKPMMWEDTETSKDVFDYYKKLIAIRKEYIDVMLGDYVTRKVDVSGNIYIYSREAGSKKLYVVINNDNFPAKVDVKVGKNAGVAKDLINGRILPVSDSMVNIELEPISGTILDI